MGKKQATILVLFGFTFSVSLLYGVYEGWYSSIFLWLLGGIGSIIFLRRHFVNESVETINLFMLAYSIYSLYMFITNFIYVKDPRSDFFMMVDSMKFWNNSNYRMYDLKDVLENFNQQSFEVNRYKLFNLLSLVLAFVAQLFDENNILVQKLQSVWLGAFSMPFIYMMFRKFFDKRTSVHYTIFFALFSYVCIYSIVFNRDPHVYFLYVLGSYLLIYQDERRFVLLKLTIILLLLLGFRIEHSLFFVTYIYAYFYLIIKRNKSLLLVIGMVSAIALAIVFPILLERYQRNIDIYETQMERVERDNSSFGAMFAQMPVGLKQSLMMVNSQIAPAVPFWRGWYSTYDTNQKYSEPGYYTPWRFMESVAAVCWIYIWAILIFGIYKKMHINTPSVLLVLFVLAVFLLLAASSSINPRRTYCVYPSIFILAAFWYEHFTQKQRQLIIRATTMSLALIYIVYFAIKGF